MDIYDRFVALKNKKGYDKQNALSLAVACQLAYAKPNKVQTVVSAWGFSLIDIINVKKGRDIDTQCFIMSDDNNMIVVFRGSDSAQDWFANFQATQDPGPLEGTGAHEGFQDSLYPAVIALSSHLSNQTENKNIWITGHSLGGALCSLFAGMLIENKIEVYGIYTFASPRPGSAEFQVQLNKLVKGPHYRVVNDGDVVPHVPPEPFYSHPGSRVILKSTRVERTKGSWLKQRINALQNFIKMTGEKFDVANNHRLNADENSYIPRLIKALNRSK